ncbi:MULTISPECIES: FUSC family protein [Lactobacillales]|uniref:Protein transporter n=1 Tax=Lactococcus garvieae TaxID=1363 RepID=A0A0D4CCL5_9LACT|nr:MULTISPECIES: FUSC family protein [Lactobacillales]AJT46500.1 Protein transporter [Lactococcus garvieae]NHI66581.1 FUSC family protein [Lactococcus petauri]PTO38798.1 hypothetical protein C6P50_12130 [Enterococcus mundtii]
MNLKEKISLDVNSLKKEIKNSKDEKEKRSYIYALLLKSLLILIPAVILISLTVTLFGENSSSFAVVLFCLWLTIRNINFGYKMTSSIISLFIIITLLLIAPLIYQKTTAEIGFFVNFFSLITIYILTVDNPMMGNAGLFSFSYIFLLQSKLSEMSPISIILLGLISYIILTVALYRHHKDKISDSGFFNKIKNDGIITDKNLWLVQLSFGISLIFYIGSFFNFEKLVWVGFACSSLLATYPKNLKKRFNERIIGIILGSLVYMILTLIFDELIIKDFSLLVGLLLGMAGTYKYQTFFNTLGALFLAGTLYGGFNSSIMRITDNLIGLSIGLIYFYFSQKIIEFILKNKSKTAS